MLNILKKLSLISKRTVVLFTKDSLELSKWSDICNLYNNVYLIKGDYLTIKHLEYIGIESAHWILITSNLLNESLFPDAIGICLC